MRKRLLVLVVCAVIAAASPPVLAGGGGPKPEIWVANAWSGTVNGKAWYFFVICYKNCYGTPLVIYLDVRPSGTLSWQNNVESITRGGAQGQGTCKVDPDLFTTALAEWRVHF